MIYPKMWRARGRLAGTPSVLRRRSRRRRNCSPEASSSRPGSCRREGEGIMEITAPRLLLRDVAAKDEAALLALDAEPSLYRYRDSSPPSQEEIRAWFRRALDLLALDPRPA